MLILSQHYWLVDNDIVEGIDLFDIKVQSAVFVFRFIVAAQNLVLSFIAEEALGDINKISAFQQRVQQKVRLEDMMRHECLLTDCLTLILAIWEVSFYFKPGKV